MNPSKKKIQLNSDSSNIDMIKPTDNYDPCENTYFAYILNTVPAMLSTIGNAISKVISLAVSVYGIYFVWTMLHFFASHLYIKLCVPLSFIGLVISPFMTATPHCVGLRWLIINGANMINNMWLIIGSWVCSVLLIAR